MLSSRLQKPPVFDDWEEGQEFCFMTLTANADCALNPASVITNGITVSGSYRTPAVMDVVYEPVSKQLHFDIYGTLETEYSINLGDDVKYLDGSNVANNVIGEAWKKLDASAFGVYAKRLDFIQNNVRVTKYNPNDQLKICVYIINASGTDYNGVIEIYNSMNNACIADMDIFVPCDKEMVFEFIIDTGYITSLKDIFAICSTNE